MIIIPTNMDTPVCNIKLKGESVEIVKKKKLPGMTIDDQLKFEERITNRKLLFCLIWFFKSQSTIFQLLRDGLPGLKQY